MRLREGVCVKTLTTHQPHRACLVSGVGVVHSAVALVLFVWARDLFAAMDWLVLVVQLNPRDAILTMHRRHFCLFLGVACSRS